MNPDAKPPPKCAICGDKGRVLRAYVDPTAALPRAKDLVPCPKCNRNPKK